MAFGDVFRLSIEFFGGVSAGYAYTNLHYSQQSILLTDDPGPALIGSFRNQAELDLLNLITNGASISAYRVRGVTNPTYGFDFLDVGASGSGGGTFVPGQVAMVVSMRTGLIGRRYRGRNFIPFLASTLLSGGVFSAPGAALGVTFGEAAMYVQTALLTNQFQLVVHSPTFNLNTPVNQAIVPLIPGAIHSRRWGVGI